MNRLRFILLLLTLLLTACGEATRDDEGHIVEEGTVSAFELKVGDCFNDPELNEDETIEALAALPCESLHDNEVFYLVDYPGDEGASFPTQEELDDFSNEQCETAFEPYVGLAYVESSLLLAPFQPTVESWAEGDREIVCILFDGEQEGLEDSMRGSER
jgi:hypothetical protein